MDPFGSFKAAQKLIWPNFVPYETHTTPAAARLVQRAGVCTGRGEKLGFRRPPGGGLARE
jgi:hypothetical protein